MTAPELLFEHDRILVYCGEWQDLGLAEGSVDVVLSDPPYTEHVHKNVRSCSTNGPLKVKVFDIPFDPLVDFEHVPQLLALARRWVVLFCALESLGDYQLAAGGPRGPKSPGAHVRSGIWRKQQAAPQLSGDRPANSCEGWAVLHRPGGKMHWNGSGKHAYRSSHEDDVGANFYDVPDFIDAGRERLAKRHPAQKPMALARSLAAWFVDKDEVVLDPYAGSGALGFAAYERGATVILVDKEPEWAQFCADRARELTSQQQITLPGDPGGVK